MKNLMIIPRTPTTAQLTVGSVHEVKLYATKDFEANSLTMKFLIPKGVDVPFVEMPDGTKVECKIAADEYLNLSWYYAAKASQPELQYTRIPFKAGEVFLTITCQILDTYETGQELELVMAYVPPTENEITGSFEPHVPGTPFTALDMYNVLPEMVLEVDSYVMPKLTQTAQKVAQGYTSKPVLPVCKNCKGRTGTRCSFGGFITAAGGTCQSYQAK